MGEPKQTAKAAKKAAKARVKIEKKTTGHRTDASPVAADAKLSPAPPAPFSPTPAERSAAAAERQARLHKWRLIVSISGVLIALATLLVMLKPRKLSSPPPEMPQAASVEEGASE